MTRIREGYRNLSDNLLQRFPSLKIVFYGYDYPRPLVGDGMYIGKYLRRQKIPDNLMEPIMRAVSNKLNGVIKEAAREFPSLSVSYLDLPRKNGTIHLG
jgi:hypothetical protein